MDEFDQIEADFMEQHPGYATASPAVANQLQVFPMSMANEYPLAQVMPVAPEPILQRRIVGVPVWGWGLGAVGVAGLAYWFLGRNKVTANPETASDSTEDLPSLPSGWQPSRSGFGERLKACLQKCGVADQTTIYIDADDAQKKLVQVSPLVTIQCKTKPPMKDLEKLAKREGLSAIEHDAGVVGFYPGTGKKGKSWEGYVDDLRDAGQKV
jgi:hypothetical protein